LGVELRQSHWIGLAQDVLLAFSGGDGIISGIKNNGDLLWYRDAPRDGTPGWTANGFKAR
jgi:hypothetical protein